MDIPAHVTTMNIHSELVWHLLVGASQTDHLRLLSTQTLRESNKQQRTPLALHLPNVALLPNWAFMAL